MFARAGIGEESAREEGEDDEEPYAGREYPPRTSRKCCEQVDEIGEGGVDFLFASQSFGNAAHEQKRAEGDDKRHDAKTGDDQAVD